MANFEMHRTAMLEMQEMVRDSYTSLYAEEQRRRSAGGGDYVNIFLPVQEGEWMLKAERIKALTAEIQNADPARRAEIIKEVNAEAAASVEQLPAIMKMAENITKMAEDGSPYAQELSKTVYELRLRMYRSGSNSVVSSGESYIQAISSWFQNLLGARKEELVEKVRSARYELDRSLSNALTFGPYNTYGENEK